MTTRDFAVAKSICQDEGMTATRSAAGFRICLPPPVSANHQMCMVAALWEMWIAVQNEAYGEKTDWIVDVSSIDELPLPLVAILSVIQVHLSQVRRNLFIVVTPKSPYSEVRM